MNITHQSITVNRTANYITLGTLSKKTKYIWFCMHGYGQTADYMSAKFDFLDQETHFVICPEGLNKFYWHDNNVPVACWMTKRYRYDEINDFVGFLDRLYDKYCRHVHQDTVINLFGFSQGCATSWRWIHTSQPRFSNLINWSGWIPEDIGYLHLSSYLGNKQLFLHSGAEDEYMTPKAIQMIKDVIQRNNLKVTFSKFEGKHHIPKTELERFVVANIL